LVWLPPRRCSYHLLFCYRCAVFCTGHWIGRKSHVQITILQFRRPLSEAHCRFHEVSLASEGGHNMGRRFPRAEFQFSKDEFGSYQWTETTEKFAVGALQNLSGRRGACYSSFVAQCLKWLSNFGCDKLAIQFWHTHIWTYLFRDKWP
jgi:hypothetical protein